MLDWKQNLRRISDFLFVILTFALYFFSLINWLPFHIASLEGFSGIAIIRAGLFAVTLFVFLHYLSSAKKLGTIFSAVLLFALFIELAPHFPLKENRSDYNPDAIRICTYNAQGYQSENWFRFFPQMGEDVAIVQEVLVADSLNLRAQGETFGYETVFLSMHPRNEIATAILTRLPVSDVDTIKVDSFNDRKRSFLCVTMSKGDFTFHLVGLHLEPVRSSHVDASYAKSWTARVRQSKVIAAYVRNLEGPVIVAGDFNATPTDRSIRAIRKGLFDSWDVSGTGWGGTWQRNLPIFRIDVVLYRGFRKATNPWRFLLSKSDHRGYQVDLVP